MKFPLFATLLLLLMTACGSDSPTAPTAPAVTTFTFRSDPSDRIGQGESRNLTRANATFETYGYGTGERREVHLTIIESNGTRWMLDMAGPEDRQLTPGIYENAARWPFQTRIQPGLAFSGRHLGCNTVSGRFVVYEATFVAGVVERLHATFEQHCEQQAPALYGEIRLLPNQ